MDNQTFENRLQAAYEAGVREGRDEGFREGISTTLQRLGQFQARLASQAYLAAEQPRRKLGAVVVALR